MSESKTEGTSASPPLSATADELVAKLLEPIAADLSITEKREKLDQKRKDFRDAFEKKERALLNAPLVKYGNFVAGRRTPARASGSMECGRIWGLQWTPVNRNEIPETLNPFPDVAKAEWADLPFLPNCKLWHLWFPQGNENPGFDTDSFAVTPVDNGSPVYLTWQSDPIHRLNRDRQFRLSKDPSGYLRYFMHLMRGTGGKDPFTLLEDPSDLWSRIPWKTDVAFESNRDEALKHVRPLERASINAKGEIRFSATIFFQTAIFRCTLAINPSGMVTMEDDDSQMQDLPVLSSEEDVLTALNVGDYL